MKILKTFTAEITDENGANQQLCIELGKSGDVYGLACHLMPADQHACDECAAECASAAEEMFGIMCREKVLPLNFYSVLDDMI